MMMGALRRHQHAVPATLLAGEVAVWSAVAKYGPVPSEALCR